MKGKVAAYGCSVYQEYPEYPLSMERMLTARGGEKADRKGRLILRCLSEFGLVDAKWAEIFVSGKRDAAVKGRMKELYASGYVGRYARQTVPEGVPDIRLYCLTPEGAEREGLPYDRGICTGEAADCRILGCAAVSQMAIGLKAAYGDRIAVEPCPLGQESICRLLVRTEQGKWAGGQLRLYVCRMPREETAGEFIGALKRLHDAVRGQGAPSGGAAYITVLCEDMNRMQLLAHALHGQDGGLEGLPLLFTVDGAAGGNDPLSHMLACSCRDGRASFRTARLT